MPAFQRAKLQEIPANEKDNEAPANRHDWHAVFGRRRDQYRCRGCGAISYHECRSVSGAKVVKESSSCSDYDLLQVPYSQHATCSSRIRPFVQHSTFPTFSARQPATSIQHSAFSIQHSAVTDHLPDRSSPCCSLNRYRATVKLPLTVFHKDSLSLDHGRDEMLAFHGHCP